MKRAFSLVYFSLFLFITTFAQSSLQRLFNGTTWTDGDAFYRAELKGDFVNMSGGTLHEGGFAFGLKCTNAKDLTFTLQNGYWMNEAEGDGYITIHGEKGMDVEVRTFDSGTYLLVNNKQGDAIYSLRQMREDESLRQIIADDLIRSFVGTYRVCYSMTNDCAPETLCTITAESMNLGKLSQGKFEVMDCFESPTNVFKLSDGRYIKLRPAGNANDLRYGLSVYEESYDEESELFADVRLLMVMERIPQTTSHWPETAECVILPGQITTHPRSELRVMRNEIFARHGYQFKSKDLSIYFEAEPWYKAVPEANNKIHFSAIESINISLLNAFEKDNGIYLPVLDEDAMKAQNLNSELVPLCVVYPWTERIELMANFENNEIEILGDKIVPYNLLKQNPMLTFEWCKAEGRDFWVGLSHLQDAKEGEIKHIVIRKKDSDLAFPMIKINPDHRPEVTIHIQGDYLWFELKSDTGKTNYFFYNVFTHVLKRSTRNAYVNRTAPDDADKLWSQILTEQLSPKAM